MRHGFVAALSAFSLVVWVEGSAAAQTAPTPAPPPAAQPSPTPAPAAAPSTPGAPAAPTPDSAAPAAAGLIGKGDSAYGARDFAAAVTAYKQELSQNASSGPAQYRLGEAELARGDTKEAELAWQNALRFAGKDEQLRSKTLFVLADLGERLKAYDDAIQRWNEYAIHTRAQPETKSHAATATERIKRIEEWKKISADAAQVKERIEKRVKEADESLRKSSK